MSEQKTYTVSAKQDHIREFFNGSKEYRKKLQLLKGNRGGVFLFNPMEDKIIQDFFLEDPEEFQFVVKTAIYLYIQAETPDSNLPEYIKDNTTIKFTNATKIKLDSLDTDYEGTPIIFNAQILGIDKLQSYTKEARMVCGSCGHKEETKNLSKKIYCSNRDGCSPRNILEVDESSIVSGNKRSIMIQPLTEESTHLEQDIWQCIVKDKDAKAVKTGQRCRLIGVLRSIPILNKQFNDLVINAITLDDLADIPEPELTEEEKSYYQKLLKQENFQDLVSESLAPEIIYETLAKFIVIVCAIGGYNKAGLKTLCHALLVGDPGSGKTQILEAVIKLVKKSGFLNGSSMTGSTATITMDQLPNKQRFPKAGTIPMCDGGIAALDELNLLYERSPEDVGRIYQGMVSQYILYDKGGFHRKLNARTTIIAGANPRYGFYDSEKGPVENINLPAPLISRFDFKLNMERKKKSAKEKSAIRKHMTLVREIGLDQYSKDNNLLSQKQLMRFVNYAQSFKPVMTPEADEKLEKFCAEMEEIEQPLGSIPLDNRFFESILIISKAIARFYLSDKITVQHIEIVLDTYKKCMASLGMNTSKGVGQFSDSKLITGKKNAFEWGLKKLQNENKDRRFTETDALTHISTMYPAYFPTEDHVQKMFDQYYEKGIITKQSGRYQINM